MDRAPQPHGPAKLLRCGEIRLNGECVALRSAAARSPPATPRTPSGFAEEISHFWARLSDLDHFY